MPRRPLSKLTPKEAEERREYMRNAQALSRSRAIEEGRCIVRSSVCTGKAKRNGTTCNACDEDTKERARQRAKELGKWPIIPSKKIPRTIRKLRREGKTIQDIIHDPYLMQYDVKRDEVSQVLKEAGLLERL